MLLIQFTHRLNQVFCANRGTFPKHFKQPVAKVHSNSIDFHRAGRDGYGTISATCRGRCHGLPAELLEGGIPALKA